MTRSIFSRLVAAACLPVFLFALAAAAHAAQPEAKGPSYIRLDAGWAGFWPHGGEYVQFAIGGDAQPSDAFHVALRPGLGMMISFADKKNFGGGKNVLEAHRDWELDYWRKNAGTLESKNRDDLAGGRHDLLVTEIDLPQQGGEPMKVYMIGVGAMGGVFVFSISPVAGDDDAMVKKIIESIKVQHKKLDLKAEAARIERESKPAADAAKKQ